MAGVGSEELWRYDVKRDERIPVTQEWVEAAQTRLNEFAALRAQVRKLVNAPFVEVNRDNEPIVHCER